MTVSQLQPASDVNLWQKRLRAIVIARYLRARGEARCVCFSCGNSAHALRVEGLQVVYVGNNALLKPGEWFTYTNVAEHFGALFDATSGHLPWPLMVEVAELMRADTPEYAGKTYIPTGSGETIVCLKLAYPNVHFTPVRGVSEATMYHAEAPLNSLVALLTQRRA